jgi:hypothetical protein
MVIGLICYALWAAGAGLASVPKPPRRTQAPRCADHGCTVRPQGNHREHPGSTQVCRWPGRTRIRLRTPGLSTDASGHRSATGNHPGSSSWSTCGRSLAIFKGPTTLASVESHGSEAAVWGERLTPRQLGRGARGCDRSVRETESHKRIYCNTARPTRGSSNPRDAWLAATRGSASPRPGP